MAFLLLFPSWRERAVLMAKNDHNLAGNQEVDRRDAYNPRYLSVALAAFLPTKNSG
ncbi:hypothetical protein [Pectobacterium fontis]|uniref:hypothetical protein n=1 Tax=Pectobacterium fontis TaxID=2558042 RepID=UPI0012B6863C|nr:hypothetical protein [Pectobacterium fontis]